jgi:hypothetical protein
MGFEVPTAVAMKSSLFSDIILSRPVKVRAGLPHVFTLVSHLAYSTLKMEAICSSETSVDFQ